MRVSRTMGAGALVLEHHHDDGEEQQGDALQQDARLHQLVRAPGVSAADHLHDADAEDAEGRQHEKRDEGEEEGFHQRDIARLAGARQGRSTGRSAGTKVPLPLGERDLEPQGVERSEPPGTPPAASRAGTLRNTMTAKRMMPARETSAPKAASGS